MRDYSLIPFPININIHTEIFSKVIKLEKNEPLPWESRD